MSASDTGEETPLVQFFSSVRKSDSASLPASRTVRLRSSALLLARTSAFAISASPNRQSLDAHGGRVDAVAELQIVGNGHRLEHLEQVTCDGQLAHRIRNLAILDPEARGATAIVTGHGVDAGADEVRDIKAVRSIGYQLCRRDFAGFEVEVVGSRRGRRRDAAMGMTRGGQPKFPRGRRIQQPGRQHALLNDGAPLNLDTLGVERLRAQAPP